MMQINNIVKLSNCQIVKLSNCQIVTEANHACVALATGDSPEKYAAVRNFRMKREKAEQEALEACKANSANCSITFSACER